MTNIRYGADSPLAALVHSFVILMTILCLSNLARYIPLIVLATILVVIAFHMINLSACKKIIQQANSREKLIFLVTLLSTLCFDLLTGVFLGVGLSVVFILWDKAICKSLSFNTFDAKDIIIEECRPQQQSNIWVKLPRSLNFINIHPILEEIESYGQSDAEFSIDFSMVFQLDLTAAQEISKAIKKVNQNKQNCRVTGLNPQIKRSMDFFGYSALKN
jgi:MFS superfamily sulfate permease-like transporter